jgi:hypothetical protein
MLSMLSKNIHDSQPLYPKLVRFQCMNYIEI